MVKNILILAIVVTVCLTGCYKESPSNWDGNLSLKLYIKYETELLDGVPVSLVTEEYPMATLVDTSDENGMVAFDDIPYAVYQAKIKGKTIVPSFLNPGEMDTILVTGSTFIEPGNDEVHIDTVRTIASGTSPGIKINEIYSAGPPNNFFYFYDQYFELYNSSEDTLYLDGMIFCRMGKFLANVTYIFQFPGEPMGGTKDYPICPGEFKVLASDAYNHRDLVFNGDVSIDLSNADFEFKNSAMLNDPDNPDVPNLENIEVGHRLDFMVGVTGDCILIGDGSDVDYTDGIDIESVIDCVEWSANPDHIKEIEDALDRGSGGIGQVKYTGTSMERISPGFDTNNSSVDFELIPAPTIGYQHE